MLQVLCSRKPTSTIQGTVVLLIQISVWHQTDNLKWKLFGIAFFLHTLHTHTVPHNLQKTLKNYNIYSEVIFYNSKYFPKNGHPVSFAQILLLLHFDDSRFFWSVSRPVKNVLSIFMETPNWPTCSLNFKSEFKTFFIFYCTAVTISWNTHYYFGTFKKKTKFKNSTKPYRFCVCKFQSFYEMCT